MALKICIFREYLNLCPIMSFNSIFIIIQGIMISFDQGQNLDQNPIFKNYLK